MAIKANFSCTYTFFFVPLHREPALRMSAHHRLRVADIIIRRLLALALAKALPKPRDREQAKIRFHAFSIFIPTGCLEPTSHRFYNKYEEKITSYVCRSVFYSDDVH